ncbi:hypothetical protein [Brucella endophytica]
MIDVLHVPYPSQEVKALLPFRLITNLAVAFGAVWLYGALRKDLPRRGWALPAIILFLLMCGLNETLRGWLMNAYCNAPFLESALFLGLVTLAGTLYYASTAALVALGWRYMRTDGQKVLGLLAIVLLLTLVISPLAALAREETATHFKYLSPLNGWCIMPYGPNILIPAYATFIEPALACMICVAFCWNYLPGGFWTKVLAFTLLIMALKQQLFAAFLYAFYAKLLEWTAPERHQNVPE